jgi:ABC-type uncharacterized transport system permease subunit
MLSGISIFCFAASYTLALLLEAGRLLWRRNRLPLRTAAFVALAGFVAHTLFLAHRASVSEASPLSSEFDWYLLASWTLAALYVSLAITRPNIALGVFLLPAVLGLIGVAQFASQEPFAVERASRFWGNVHGSCLLLGAVTVILGFLAGLMYLLQSYRLKHKLPPTTGFRLPSLEWLQKLNSRALLMSVVLIGGGFVSGVILNNIRHRHEVDYVPWSDPVVILTGLMFGYLLAAEIFSLVYRPARAGRKVAYLTVASFLFLVLTLAVLLSGQTQHGTHPDKNAGATAPAEPSIAGRRT